MAKKNIFPICGTSLTVLGQEANRDSEQFAHNDHRSETLALDIYDAFFIGEFTYYRAYNNDPENSNPGEVFLLDYYTSSDQTLIDSSNFLSEESAGFSIGNSPILYLSDGYIAKRAMVHDGSPTSRAFDGKHKYLLEQHGEKTIPIGSIFTVGVKSAKTSSDGKMFTVTFDYNSDGTNKALIRSAGKWLTFMVVNRSEFGIYNLVPLGSNNWV